MNKFVFKNFIANDKGEQVRTSGGILCTFQDENGKEKMMVVAEEVVAPTAESGRYPIESSSQQPVVNESAITRNTPCVHNKPNKKAELWNEGGTKMVLDKYADDLPHLGPLKKFRNKKRIWDQISEDIQKSLNHERSSAQCENRYKTVMKRKVHVTRVNNTSGSSPREILFEDEINNIKAIDNSLEPEVLMGVDKCEIEEKVNTRPSSLQFIQKSSSETGKKRRVMTLPNVLKELHNDKESSKERRHKEKLELMKDLLSKD